MKTYIKELKKHLSPLPSNKKNEIIKEIQSSVDDKSCTYDDMVAKFGTPNNLADNYLEDMPIKVSLGGKIFSRTRNITAIFTLIVIGIVISAIFYIYTKSLDEFDYSKYTAVSIHKKVDNLWKEALHIKNIDIDQAMVVFYWSDKEALEYSCKGGSTPIIKHETLQLRHSICYIKVPKKELIINLHQSKTTLIHPTSPIILKTDQSEIRLSSKNQAYNFNIKLHESKIEGMKNSENGIKIRGNLTQSILKPYKY